MYVPARLKMSVFCVLLFDIYYLASTVLSKNLYIRNSAELPVPVIYLYIISYRLNIKQ